MKPNLLTADATAEQLKITRRTLQNWTRYRSFPQPFYLGKRAYYTQDDINGFINKTIDKRNSNDASGIN